MLKLTRHFIKNWRKRVGGDPDPDAIRKMIREAIRIQKGKRARTRYAYIKTLTIYWHADLDLIITVDLFRQTVVSVYSKRNMPNGGAFGVGDILEGVI